ncbi:uncharacterized protein LOC110834792 [Zootermopsis nevadensis]|uniref:uncharacterized protein LOC110834792 n=1 Tax=Zootermopsis nevadensis TaxID=136037 RepID=UPI000B8EC12A|nr:uncharacterized protein LOC110834792 [Zootermopsis nevadensis]
MTDYKHEDVMKAAKLLFCKRSRTLHHWLNPDLTKRKLDDAVLAAWNVLPDNERRLYIAEITNHSFLFCPVSLTSQTRKMVHSNEDVLGRSPLGVSSLKINPQLNVLLRELPEKNRVTSCTRDSADETGQAVQELLASSCDLQASSSYPESKPQNTTNICRKRKSLQSRRTPLGDVDLEDLDEETGILNRECKLQAEAEIKLKQEVTCEVEKTLFVPEFRTQDEEDNFLIKNLDLKDLFPGTGLLSETEALVDDDVWLKYLDPEGLLSYADLLSETGDLGDNYDVSINN